MGKPLTLDLVLQRSKADHLEDIRNLNLWGNDIDDVSILKDMRNVEVLSLSANKITTLRDFQHCTKLTELYLRKNLISDLSEVRYLQRLPSLKVLWLWDNPCAESPNYRPYVIRCLPNLVKLDSEAVSPEERKSRPALPEESSQNREAGVNSAPPQGVPEGNRDYTARPILSEARNSRPHQERAPQPRAEVRSAIAENEGRNQNVLCAVMALLRVLEGSEMSVLREEVDNILAQRRS